MAVDSKSERGAFDVTVRQGHHPIKQSLMIETTDQSGSNAHTDGRHREISPPDGPRSGHGPVQDPIQGSCQATRKIQDPSLAKGSPTSLPSREGIAKRSVEESRVEHSNRESDYPVVNSPVSLPSRRSTVAPEQTANESGRSDPLLLLMR